MKLQYHKPEETNPKIKRTINMISRWKPNERMEAEQHLHNIGQDELTSLLSLFNQEVIRNRKKSFLTSLIWLLIPVSLLFSAYIVNTILLLLKYRFLVNSLFVFYVSLFIYDFMLRGRKLKKIVRALGNVNDPRAIEPLIEALDIENIGIASSARTALKELLMRLGTSQSYQIDKAHRLRLCRAMERSAHNSFKLPSDVEFVVTVLETLKHIGGKESLPIVARLASRTATTQEETHIRNAAQVCLPYLHQRAEQEADHITLVRAANSIDISSDVLLHPSGEITESDPKDLLRTSMPPENLNL